MKDAVCFIRSKKTFRCVEISVRGDVQKPLISPPGQSWSWSTWSPGYIACFLKLQDEAVILPEPACADCFGDILRAGLSVLTSGANAVIKR